MTYSLPSLALLGLLLAAIPAQAEEPAFKVIANAGITVEPLSPKEVSQIFLKKTSTWPSGLKITPVDLGVDHPTREEFSQAIHGKGAHPIERRWETLIFSGMGVPPVQVENETEVVEFIKNNAGAVGYVAADISLPAEVKELEIEK